jgi:hypothetical protein
VTVRPWQQHGRQLQRFPDFPYVHSSNSPATLIIQIDPG